MRHNDLLNRIPENKYEKEEEPKKKEVAPVEEKKEEEQKPPETYPITIKRNGPCCKGKCKKPSSNTTQP